MLNVREVAERLRVSATCVYQLIEQGKLACHRIGIGRGAIRVSAEDLEEFIDGCREKRNAGARVPPQSIRLKHLKQ
jgi:excisionase family DNA binding protein